MMVAGRVPSESAGIVAAVSGAATVCSCFVVVSVLVWQPGAHEWHGRRVTHGSVTDRNQQVFQCTCTLVRTLAERR